MKKRFPALTSSGTNERLERTRENLNNIMEAEPMALFGSWVTNCMNHIMNTNSLRKNSDEKRSCSDPYEAEGEKTPASWFLGYEAG